MNIKNRHALGVFSLAMITASSVDSIRNLPTTALFGSSLIFFFILGAIFFLLPSALISAELSSTSYEKGGIYRWVHNAFGLQAGLLAIWFQWIENVIWYPTILSFVAGTIGYIISPALASNNLFLTTIILFTFWGMTLLNLAGIKSSARFANLCAIFGLLLPMTLIIALGVVWFVQGQPIQIHFNKEALFPHFNNNTWVALTGVILSFCGMEIATVHDGDVNNPQRAYPRAMLIATLIILSTLIFGSLAIAIVLPAKNISLVAGIMQTFQIFLSAYHLQWLLWIIAITLILGGLGGINNWIIAPTRGLQLALRDINIAPRLCKDNLQGAPAILLISQAVIASLVTIVFLLMPSVNGSYWLLTVLSSQLYMFMYILLFLAGIRLRYKEIKTLPGFRIPGKNIGMWIVAGAGLIGAITTLIIGFIPPDNINVGVAWHYQGLLLLGLLIMSLPPILIFYYARNRSRSLTNSTIPT